MRVFVTGATGFLGGALARSLCNSGAEVHVMVRSGSNRRALDGLAVHFHEADITIPETLKEALRGCSWIIHAAGKLGEAGVPEEKYRLVHVEGTRNLLAAAFSLQPQPRILYVSSPGVLGPVAGEPAREDAPYAPSNPYERTKAAAEEVALEFASRGLPVIVARPEFVYGPGDLHVLRLFHAVKRGRFFYIDGGRHFCHPTFIADAVDGMLLCLGRGRPSSIYHITGPHPVTFRELGDAIAEALGVPSPRLSIPKWLAIAGAGGLETLGRLTGQPPPLSRTGVAFFSEDRRFSSQKAYDELGYTPKYDLETGIASAVAWYREHNLL